MRRIKIAQIGMNQYSHGPEVFHTIKTHPEVFELVGYVLVEDEWETCASKIKECFAGYPELSLDEVLNDTSIEAVAIETDEVHLLKYAQMAAEAGKHIHMEKPGSQNLTEFERLIETMRETGKIFNVGYMYRYHPLISQAIKEVRTGKFGHVFSVEAHMSRWDNTVTREWFGNFRGGMMFYLGCHLIDLILQLQGVPEKIIPMNTVTGIDGIGTEDFAFAVFQYPNATSVIRVAGTELNGYNRRQLVICGEKKNVEIRPLEAVVGDASEKFMLFSEKDEISRNSDGHIVSKHIKSAPFQRYKEMMLTFAAMVRGDKAPVYSLEYELLLFKTILTCCGM